MTHFVRVRQEGQWQRPIAFPDVLTSAEVETFDAQQFAAISEAGGTWSPSAAIVVSGEDLRVMGIATLSDARAITVVDGGVLRFFPTSPVVHTVGANAVIRIFGELRFEAWSGLVVADGATFNAAAGSSMTIGSSTVVVMGHGPTSQSGTWSWGGDLTISGQFLVESEFTIKSGATLELATSVDSHAADWLFGGDVTFAGPVTLGDSLSTGTKTISVSSAKTVQRTGSEIVQGAEAQLQLRRMQTADADATYSFEADVFLVPADLSTDRTYTLRDAGVPAVPAGARCCFRRFAGTNDLTIQREDLTALVKLPHSETSWVEFDMGNDSTWRISAWGDDLVFL